ETEHCDAVFGYKVGVWAASLDLRASDSQLTTHDSPLTTDKTNYIVTTTAPHQKFEMKTALLISLSITLLIFSCRKDSYITSPDASLTISADTLHYDTVFTTVGSVTQTFKIINDNNQKLRLSSVKLMGGSGSNFKINIDGAAATEANNIEIEANDSIYVFVQVNVEPNTENLPFIIRDSIGVNYNGKTKWVQLEAWGQNAHFLRDK